MKWDVVYKRAIQDDGSLLFPQILSREFLDHARKVMGSYLFANQYQNEIIPEDLQNFKKHWFKYYETLPAKINTFAFIDPAISQEHTADFTGVTVVSVDTDNHWYVRLAQRYKITPTEIIDLMFRIQDEYKPMVIGIETQAYQEALLYMLDLQMRTRGKILPVHGVKHGNEESKSNRILGLVPRFEWGRIYLSRGLTVLEDELLKFPRGGHDDVLDALASIEKIAIVPEKDKIKDNQPNPADAVNYEAWYRRQLSKRGNNSSNEEYGAD